MADSKHFSHPHSLSYLTIHRMPEGETIDCSGCNLAASGAAYACLKCKFFLHEKCFHATRSIKHPSHPLHHLTLVPSPTYPSGQFTCHSCFETGHGLSYSCPTCDFDLHVHCASVPPGNTTPAQVPPHSESLMTGTTSSSTEPSIAQTQIHHKSHEDEEFREAFDVFDQNGDGFITVEELRSVLASLVLDQGGITAEDCKEIMLNVDVDGDGMINFNEFKQMMREGGFASRAQTQIHHKSHAKHALVLHSRHPNSATGEYKCDGCGENGNDSVYRCSSTCDYDLHVECAGLEEQVRRVDHQHPLTLFYSNPYTAEGMILECNVCHYNVPQSSWVYCCLDWDYGTHVKCVRAKARSKEVVELENFVATQHELSLMQVQMTAFSAQIADIGAGIARLA